MIKLKQKIKLWFNQLSNRLLLSQIKHNISYIYCKNRTISGES